MFLKNKNIIFKVRRSKVTDYAALNSQVTDAWTLPSARTGEFDRCTNYVVAFEHVSISV